MSSLITLVLIVALYGSEVASNTFTTREPEKIEILPKNDSFALQNKTSRSSILLKRLESINAANAKTIANTTMDKDNNEKTFNKRKSRFLGSLAFLAGLGIGGLNSAASSSVKAYATFPQGSIAMNFVPSKVGAYLSPYYDPYPFLSHPYAYQNPLGLYPFLDPSKLQSLIGGSSQQSGGNRPTQILTLFDNKKPTDTDDNDDEEFIIEQTKLDKKKPSSRLENRSDEITDSQIDVDRKTEEEIASNAVTCRTSKRREKEENPRTEDPMDYYLEDLQQVADDSRVETNFHRNFTTVRPIGRPTPVPTRRPSTHHHHHHNHTSDPLRPVSSTNTPMTSTSERVSTDTPITSTTESNNTIYPPFYGYYGGSPQDISHIELTSGTQSPIYQEPNPINYNLPYERPADFYPDEKYSYYSNSYPSSYPNSYPTSYPSSYPPGPFLPEQLSDYSRNDFDRFLYSPDNNSPRYISGFKPVT